MTAPNRNTLWARTLVEELAAAGIDGVCLAPGSRSTPLTLAFAEHEAVETFSHLDERSAAFFALGRGKATGTPTPVVCTSGTAAANFHPAVLEASEARVPLLLLTADRPPELADSGANQTTDQEKLYGDAVRYYRTLPEPRVNARTLRSLRVTAARAASASTAPPAGPVHLNVPFEKPLEPIPIDGDVPDGFEEDAPLAASGRDGPFVDVSQGVVTPARETVADVAADAAATERGLIVCGPADREIPSRPALVALARATGFPVLADPLSGHRFGTDRDGVTVCGGYDSYLAAPGVVPDPDLVLRFGASPTSKVLRTYLAGTGARQVQVDPAGEWREAEFTATDLVIADPDEFARAVAAETDGGTDQYRERFAAVERRYWELVGGADSPPAEGALVGRVAADCPDGTTLFVSNSMPVRDLDRFGRPTDATVRVFGNRGVSGIDGITSTALGAGSGTDGPLVVLVGDLAFYHDMNGLLALTRCGIDATIVVLNNDGGGIFHKLPIESFDPPFTEQFKTPHGLEFGPTGELYDIAYERYETVDGAAEAVADAVGDGNRLIEVALDGERSHRDRERLHEQVCAALGEG